MPMPGSSVATAGSQVVPRKLVPMPGNSAPAPKSLAPEPRSIEARPGSLVAGPRSTKAEPEILVPVQGKFPFFHGTVSVRIIFISFIVLDSDPKDKFSINSSKK